MPLVSKILSRCCRAVLTSNTAVATLLLAGSAAREVSGNSLPLLGVPADDDISTDTFSTMLAGADSLSLSFEPITLLTGVAATGALAVSSSSTAAACAAVGAGTTASVGVIRFCCAAVDGSEISTVDVLAMFISFGSSSVFVEGRAASVAGLAINEVSSATIAEGMAE